MDTRKDELLRRYNLLMQMPDQHIIDFFESQFILSDNEYTYDIAGNNVLYDKNEGFAIIDLEYKPGIAKQNIKTILDADDNGGIMKDLLGLNKLGKLYMKRCFRGLINWFTQWVRKMNWQEKIGFVLGGLLGIATFIIVLVSIDKVPATPIDYESLEQQAINVQKNPELLLETNCSINIDDEVITITFENDECKVYAKYNKNLELLSYSKEDNYTLGVWAVCIAIVIGIWVYGLGAFALTMLFFAMVNFLTLELKKRLKK